MSRETPPVSTLRATVLATDEATGGRLLQFDVPVGASLETLLAHYGQIPLPPYITETQASPEQYQTVYAQPPGALAKRGAKSAPHLPFGGTAGPTAGLHFTSELLERCAPRGVRRGAVRC